VSPDDHRTRSEYLLSGGIHKQRIARNMQVEEEDSSMCRSAGARLFESRNRYDNADHGDEVADPAELQVQYSAKFVDCKGTNGVTDNCDVAPDTGEEKLLW
jgi:hypothetical protein